MGRLGARNVNVNVNVAAGGLVGAGSGVPARFNSHELPKQILPGLFPSVPSSPEEVAAYRVAQDTANQVKFRQHWDAELRGYVYLNEFVVQNPRWLPDFIQVIDKKALHEKLHQQRGEQLLQVIEAAGDREERFAEIIDQHDGEGAIKYWLGMLMIDGASAPATYQLIRVARRVGEMVVMCLKEHYREPRPSQICAAVLPMVDPPVTPAFPAGHALQSYLISRCLAEVRRPREQHDLLFALARRVAENRVIAGLHYPLDNQAGVVAAEACFELLRQGKRFGKLLEKARAEGEPQPEPEPEEWP